MEDTYWSRRRRTTRRGFLRGLGLAAGVAGLGPVIAACGSNTTSNTTKSNGAGTQSSSSASQNSSAVATSAAVATSTSTVARKASAPGVTADTILLGSTYALSGPNSAYDPCIQVVQAYLQKVNEGGGVNGRKIKLQVEDDVYSPANTVPLAKKLVEQDRVFAIVTPLGTPTNTAVVDYYNEQKVPHLFPISGGNKWGDYKKYPWTVGFLPAYGTEGKVYAKYVNQTWPGKKVGVLYQNDDYGKDYYFPFRDSLGKENQIIDEETYEATASDVSQQITNLKNKNVEVFLLISTPKFSGLALKAAGDQGWKPNIVMNSVSADAQLFGLAGPQNVEGVISDGFWVDPSGSDPALQPVKDLIAKYTAGTQLAGFAMWGYIAGTLLVESLKRAGPNPTRESLLAAVESFKDYKIDQLLPGITISTSKTDHEPIKAVKLNKATAGKFVYFGDVISGA